MPYKPKGIRPMKGTGAIIINVLPSSTILTPPTFFKAKMDENFFFSYLVFFKEKNSSTLTLREFPGGWCRSWNPCEAQQPYWVKETEFKGTILGISLNPMVNPY